MSLDERDQDSDVGSLQEADDQAIGPTSAVTQSHPAPWQLNTLITDLTDIPENHGTDFSQLPLSPTAALETLPQTSKSGPNARFKQIVMQVIARNRLRNLTDDEPGVRVSGPEAAALYGHYKEECSIQVMDYGPTKFRKTELTNSQLEDYIAHEKKTRPLWSKVRWINIGGISFDVVKSLAIRYHIHPLVIEDILHGRQAYSSKADYYSRHLFLRMLCHTLKAEDDPSPCIKPQHIIPVTKSSKMSSDVARDGTPPPTYSSRTATGDFDEKPILTAEPTSISQTGMRKRIIPEADGSTRQAIAGVSMSAAQPWVSSAFDDPEKALVHLNTLPAVPKPRKYSARMASIIDNNLSRTRHEVDDLKKGERVEVKLRTMYIIMFRDGTLITIHQDPGSDFFDPIMKRLRQRDTLLRNAAEPSLLLQGIVDLLVDHAVRVVDKYHDAILKFEKDILIKPKMRTVRALHIASGDLTTHKRTLSPLKTLIYGLRRYDLDRCIAQANPSDPNFDEKKVVGFMSHKSKIYLGDVLDHMDYILASLEMFESITENLIAYTFNIISYDMNTTMRTLTVATVIFLPLTFLTGYFGQNFSPMPSVNDHSEVLFWEIAIPVMVVTIAGFNYPSIMRLYRYLTRTKAQKQAALEAKQK